MARFHDVCPVQVPLDRWDIDLATASGVVKRRRDPVSEKYSRHGSFVRDFDLFDNAFFSVPEKEASEIDPQQRVLIQVCAEALFNSGLAARGWQSTNTAVYVGICNNDFDTLLRSQAVSLTLAGSSQDEISSQVRCCGTAAGTLFVPRQSSDPSNPRRRDSFLLIPISALLLRLPAFLARR